MYHYQEDISFDDILSEYSQEEIMAIVFGEQVYNTYVCSPFRVDNNPGCYFNYYNDKLWFVDFADIKKTRDCFEVIKDKFNLSFTELPTFIAKNIKNRPILKKKKIIKKVKKLFDITYKIRPWQKEDRIFWESFKISKKQLIEDSVIPIYWYKTIGFFPDDFVVRPLKIAYAILVYNHIKIYQPYGNKRQKWFTNCNGNEIGNLQKLDVTNKNLIITKSYKDCRIIRNQGYKNTIWVQNETYIPNTEILYDLSLRFNNVYTIFDNDRQGIEYTNKIIETFNQFNKKVKPIFMPSPNHKDPGEVIKQFGEIYLFNYLKEKIL